MFNIYFEDSQRERRLLASNVQEKDIMKPINKFLKEKNYKGYYTRMWINDKFERVYDVGSHSEFFIAVVVKKNTE